MSGIVISDRLPLSVVRDANSKIIDMCNEYSFIFVDNSNILHSNHFYDGLHLAESGKRILANNFIGRLNCFLTPGNQSQIKT